MRIINRYSIAKDISLEDFKKVRQMAMEDLFASIARHNIELDKAYSFIVTDDRYECFGDSYFPETENRKMAITFEPIPEVRMVYKAPEDLHLTPSKSIKTKLKNCWKYLRDNSEGYYEQEK